MHQAAANFIVRARQHLLTFNDPDVLVGFEVIEIGSRDINGRASTFWGRHHDWIGIDIADGPNVDVVGDAAVILGEWNDTGEHHFDLAISCEVFEHAANWRQILIEMHSIADYVLVTCAGEGRAPHSAIDGGQVRPDEYYQNVTQDEMAKALADIGASPLIIEHNRAAGDLYVLAQ